MLKGNQLAPGDIYVSIYGEIEFVVSNNSTVTKLGNQHNQIIVISPRGVRVRNVWDALNSHVDAMLSNE